MKHYLITVWHDDSITKLREVTRKRRDAAQLQFERAVYDTLEAYGKLDTEAAHRDMKLAKQSAKDIVPSDGSSIKVKVSNTGCTVYLRAA